MDASSTLALAATEPMLDGSSLRLPSRSAICPVAAQFCSRLLRWRCTLFACRVWPPAPAPLDLPQQPPILRKRKSTGLRCSSGEEWRSEFFRAWHAPRDAKDRQFLRDRACQCGTVTKSHRLAEPHGSKCDGDLDLACPGPLTFASEARFGLAMELWQLSACEVVGLLRDGKVDCCQKTNRSESTAEVQVAIEKQAQPALGCR